MHGQGGKLSTKIIKNRKEFYLNQTSPEVSFPDYSGKKKLLQKSKVSRTVFYLVRTKNVKQVGVTFFSSFKKKEQTSMYTMSQYGLGSWEGSPIREGRPELHPRMEGIRP